VEKNVEKFQYLLKKKWTEVFASDEPNIYFKIFMDIFSYYFNTVFPLKVTYTKVPTVNTWTTKGITVSKNKLGLINSIKRSSNLSMGSLMYIRNYQLIYRKVIKEAKWRGS
jgi:hypothetical protein